MTATAPTAPGRRGALAALRSLLPSRADYAQLPRTWRGDLLAGLTVGIVALPLGAVLASVIAAVISSVGLRLVFVAIALLVAVMLTTALLYEGPRSPSTVKHVDLVDQILSTHTTNSSVGVYNGWPGFFSSIA